MEWRFRGRMPAGFSQPLSTWLWVFGINLGLSLLPQIDMLGHVGGLVGGVIATALVTSKDDELPIRRTDLIHLLIAVALSTLFAVGLLRAGEHYFEAGLEDGIRVAESRDDPVDVALGLNEPAWFEAINPEATEANLNAALHAAERAVGLVETSTKAQIQDTLATVHYRLRNFDRAILLEREVLGLDPKKGDVYATQLARFLLARLDREHAPWVMVESAPELNPRLDPRDRMLTLESAGAEASDLRAYVIALDDKRIVGLAVLGTDTGPVAIPKDWPKEVTLQVGLITHESVEARIWSPSSREAQAILSYP